MCSRAGWLIVAAVAAAAPLHGQVAWQPGDQEWCERSNGGGNSERFCEVRTATLPATGGIEVDGRLNGGIDVEAWDGGEVQVVARVSARAATEERAAQLAGGVDISAGDRASRRAETTPAGGRAGP